MGEVFRLTRSQPQIAALRAICEAWGPPATGSERFWGFADVLAAVGRPGSVAVFVAAEADAPWQGVALADAGPDAADLLYVYVAASCRRQGLARRLLLGVSDHLRQETAVSSLFLEVRQGNREAQRLYESLGMQRIGERRRYYADGEDALVFRWELTR